ncbi:MAG: deoxyribose-phosphate aldolase, partial [Acidobacteria bacterium]|nr:deoxyribose-phosphate aldolase [Acidobacteriota bacterium]
MLTREAVSELTVETVAKAMDYMVLAPDHTFRDIEQTARDAAQYGFASLCLSPYAVSYVSRLLRGKGVAICGAVGLPLGHSGLKAKCDEASFAIESGAGQIDMVINLVAMKSSRYADVQAEIAAVRKLASGLALKVTLECCYLTDAEKARAAKLAIDAGADVIKTHTGFGRTGVGVRDVLLLRHVVNGAADLEAAGGIASFKQFRDLTLAGATHLATSSAVAIIKDFLKWERIDEVRRDMYR